jgi:hypothetical protein
MYTALAFKATTQSHAVEAAAETVVLLDNRDDTTANSLCICKLSIHN